MFNKKIKKLIRDPKLFIVDLVKKQEKKLGTLKKINLDCGYKFTVISAVFNAERYLDDFFKSIVSQKLNFKKHIKIILVDDGSLDNSAKKIKEWSRRYPNNISYIYKENGGQASARNLGLTKVDTEWVGFIDPDDFINNEYFSCVSSYIDKNKDIDVVSCKMIVYKEESKSYADTQPLRFCFEKAETLRNCNDLEDLVQLSASSAIFKTDVIKTNNVSFNHDIKPNFEDGKFVIDYLSYCSGKIIFLNKPNYYYRVRGDNSSTTNTQWEKEEKYSNVLEFGILDMLHKYYTQNEGKVPRFAQRTALYFLVQYFSRIINNEPAINFLSVNQKETFLKLLDKIFYYIDDAEILKFNLLGTWFYHKIGMQALFKAGTGYNFQIAYIKNFDNYKNEIQVSYYSHEIELEQIKVNNIQTLPSHVKTIKHEFLGRYFYERILWIKFENLSQNITIELNKSTEISVIGQSFKGKVAFSKIKEIFLKKSPTKNEDKNTWLFIDSENRADDNAEHLYRYLSNCHKNINSYFVLNRSSKDWNRLEKEGFNLVAFGSSEFKRIYDKAGVLLSSHIDKCFTQYNGRYSLTNKKFIFLQHGVTKDNISSWLNNTSRIDGILTSTLKEYESLANNDSPYNFDSRNILLTGMPRYDNLFSLKNGESSSNVLIMPTWRRDLVGKTLKNTSSRSYNNELVNSQYFIKWQEVLSSAELKDIHENNNVSISFMPHPNLLPYLKEFSIPSYIEIIKCDEVSVQKLLANTKILVTDYSSVAFDVALVGGKCVYYQFDEEEVFSGAHTYSRGYYNYHTDGFGPVVYNEKSLFEEIKKSLCNINVNSDFKAKETFAFIDDKNCERAYKDILTIINPSESNSFNCEISYDYAQMAYKSNNWELSLQRWNQILSGSEEFHHAMAKQKIISSLLKLNKLNEAIVLSERFYEAELMITHDNVKLNFSKIYIATKQWDKAESYLTSINVITTEVLIMLMQCFAETFNLVKLNSLLYVSGASQSNSYNSIFKAWGYYCNKQWNELIFELEGNLDNFSQNEMVEYKPHLLLARAYQEITDFDCANNYLQMHESFDKGNIQLRFQIASLASAKQQWSKVVAQLDATNLSVADYPLDFLVIYLKALRQQNKSNEALTIVNKFDNISLNDTLTVEIAEIYFALKNWNSSAEHWMKLKDFDDNAHYKLAIIYRNLGMIKEGRSLLLAQGLREPQTLDEWVLKAELAELSNDWADANHCWSSILRYHSDVVSNHYWERLSNSKLLSEFNLLTGSLTKFRN